jgi:glycosyltransferase involved in cell wall biosynthesis
MSDSINRKRILITVPRIPFPLNSGGRIAIYDAIKLLSKRFDITLVVIDDNNDNRKYIDEFAQFSDDIHFYSKPRYRFLINAIFGLFKGKPLQVGYFYFREVQNLVDRLSLSCDFYYAFMIRTTTYGANLPVKKGHYAIDSMYLNYKKSEEKTTSHLWKLIYKIELPLLYRTEARQVKEYDLTTFVNKDEAAFWSEYGTVATLPHGVTKDVLSYNKTGSDYANVIAFIGRMDYQPNIEAVLWFCKNIVTSLNPELEFWIIGGYPTQDIIKLGIEYKNVKVKGFVDDPNVILKSCVCTVAPMQSGGGLQTKILMAMALESIVISSSLPIGAIEGGKNGLNIIVEDEPYRFCEIINDIYLHPSNYQKIKEEAKKLINENYALDVIELKMFDLINNYLIK